MKTVFAALALAGLAALTASPASAQRAGAFPWCAGNTGNPTSNCGFTSYRQCMASVQGMGGMTCRRNPLHGAASNPRRPSY
jgi:hypothetical protein